MESNPITSTVVGLILLGVLGAGAWGLLFGLERLCTTFNDKHTLGAMLSAPIVIFIAYLVGNGFLENRGK